MNSMIKDIALAPTGHQKIAWVKEHMPLLNILNERYAEKKIFDGLNMVVTIHLEAKTAYLAQTLKNCGANVVVTGSNPLSTQDDVAAALADSGITVFATHACSQEEYDLYLSKALDTKPSLIIDDGGDLVNMLHSTRRELIPNLIGGSEETTTGVHRLYQMMERGELLFPAFNVNDSVTKSKFDNLYGCRESLADGIKRATDVMIAGKGVVVCGCGDVGKGCARSMRSYGARVIVTEIDPICALQAAMEGFEVKTVESALAEGNIYVTCTGNCDIITLEHMQRMRDQAIVCNIGHFDNEIQMARLETSGAVKLNIKPQVDKFTFPDGHSIFILAEGRLVNLGCATGHPSFVMSNSFTNQCLAQIELWQKKLEVGVYRLPKHLDEEVARLHLDNLGVELTQLTKKQADYIGVPVEGPYKAEHYRY